MSSKHIYMASSTMFDFAHFCILSLVLASFGKAQLVPNFYSKSCPNVETIVRNAMVQTVNKDTTMAASILRLFFHDCFVNGCDASVLLDDTPMLKGENNAFGNQNSLRGFKLIDQIKLNVEGTCKATVSCADILALAAPDAVVLVGGSTWIVPLGRRDSRTASLLAANTNLPPQTASLATLISMFASKNLTARDMTALSGAHTLGQARCVSFRTRIYNETNINPAYAIARKANCPAIGGDNNLAPLDDGTPNQFDNKYFKNLMAKQGLLHSDQELFNGGSQDSWVRLYARSNYAFGKDFVAAMVKLGNVSPPTGRSGEIRRHCRVVN